MKKYPEHNCDTALGELLERMERSPLDRDELHELCGKYPGCSKSLVATYEQWQQLDELELPEPSPAMHTNFYKMLSEMSAGEAAKQVRTPYKWWNWNNSVLKWALIAGVFIMGVFTGGFFRSTSAEDSLVNRIEGEQEQKKRDYYAQLTSHSVIDRLQATQMAKQMEQLDDKIIDALFQTLIRDENVNVRLSAIETMLHFTDNPKVRESLIRAIPYQQAPLVQLTLAEVMTALKDKRAIEEIRRLLRDEQVEVEVKMKLEDTIETLL